MEQSGYAETVTIEQLFAENQQLKKQIAELEQTGGMVSKNAVIKLIKRLCQGEFTVPYNKGYQEAVNHAIETIEAMPCSDDKGAWIGEVGEKASKALSKRSDDLQNTPLHYSDSKIVNDDKLVEALTPSSKTKAAYIGQFHFNTRFEDEYCEEYSQKVIVPWTTTKEIMAAILAYSGIKDKGAR